MTEFSESHDDPFALHLVALAVLDDRGVVVGWNQRAQELLGHPDTAVIGRPAFEVLVGPSEMPAAREAAAKCRKAGGWFGVLKVRHRDGRLVEMGLRAHALSREGQTSEWLLAGALAADVLEWQRDRAVLDGLYRQCPIGLVVHGTDLRLLRVNRAIERFSGVPAAGFEGLPSGQMLIPDDARKALDRVRQVMETGRPLVYSEQFVRLEQDPGRERVALVSSFRMEDPAGRILGVAEMIEDITDRHRAQRRLALLDQAGSRIGTTLDVAETARELAEVMVPHLADHASVDLLQPVTRGEELAPVLAGPVVRLGASSVGATTPGYWIMNR